MVVARAAGVRVSEECVAEARVVVARVMVEARVLVVVDGTLLVENGEGMDTEDAPRACSRVGQFATRVAKAVAIVAEWWWLLDLGDATMVVVVVVARKGVWVVGVACGDEAWLLPCQYHHQPWWGFVVPQQQQQCRYRHRE